jgi:hypothetical protein
MREPCASPVRIPIQNRIRKRVFGALEPQFPKMRLSENQRFVSPLAMDRLDRLLALETSAFHLHQQAFS